MYDEQELDDILDQYDENGRELVKTGQKKSYNDNMDALVNAGNKMIQQEYNSGKKDMGESIKDIAHLTMAGKALDDTDENNDKFIKQSVDLTQTAITKSLEATILQEEANKLRIKKQKAEAFYINFRPILEFDFSNLRKVKKVKIASGEKDSRGREGKNIYEYKQEAPKTYEDRSYGIPLMVLMLCLLTVPYCLVTIVLSIFNAINEIFMQIANYGKSALIICSSLAGVTIIGLVVYVVLLVVQNVFGITIIG